jgi:hypothetical protein
MPHAEEKVLKAHQDCQCYGRLASHRRRSAIRVDGRFELVGSVNLISHTWSQASPSDRGKDSLRSKARPS